VYAVQSLDLYNSRASVSQFGFQIVILILAILCETVHCVSVKSIFCFTSATTHRTSLLSSLASYMPNVLSDSET